jgi:LEA14-like dessication related protein
MPIRTPKLRIRPLRHLPLVVLGSAALTACALVQRFSFVEPTVDLAAVRVTALTLSGGSVDLVLDVHNPNPYALRGGRFEGDLALEDTPFGSVSRSAPWTLPAQGDTALTVQLAFAWSAVGAAARAVLDRGSVRYRLAGRVLVATPADERWVRLEQRGEVPVERLLR